MTPPIRPSVSWTLRGSSAPRLVFVVLALLWLCLASAAFGSELSLVAVDPCVVLDTAQASTGPLNFGFPQDFVVLGETTDYSAQGGSATGCGVSTEAVSVVVAMTASTNSESSSILLRALPGVTEDGFLMRDDQYSEHVILPLCHDAGCAYELRLEMIGLSSSFDTQMEVVAEVSGYFVPSSAEVGDITAVTPGSGLAGGGTEGDVSLRADFTTTQARVADICWGGTLVGMLKSGKPICEADDDTLATLGCSAGEVPEWNGSSWACATTSDTLGALDCTTDQIARWDGSSWVCSSETTIQPQSCEEGTILTGFDASGAVICTHPDPTLNLILGEFSSVATELDVAGRPVFAFQSVGSDEVSVALCEQTNCNSYERTVLRSDIRTRDVAIAGPMSFMTYPLITFVDREEGELWAVSCNNFNCSSFTSSLVATGLESSDLSDVVLRPEAPDFGNPLIVFTDSGSLKVADCANAECSSSSIHNLPEGVISADPAIALASDGKPIIVYEEGSGSSTVIAVAHCADSDCSGAITTTELDLPVTSSSPEIAIGLDGLPFVTSADGVHGLRTVHCSEVDCSESSGQPNSVVSIDEVGSPMSASVTIGGRDHLPILTFYDLNLMDFRVLHCNVNDCSDYDIVTIPEEDGNILDGRGMSNALVMGADGLPIVVYSGTGTFIDNLIIHRCPTSECM